MAEQALIGSIIIPVMVLQTGDKNALKNLDQQIQILEKALVKLNRTSDESKSKTETLKKSHDTLTKAVAETKIKTAELDKGLKGFNKTLVDGKELWTKQTISIKENDKTRKELLNTITKQKDTEKGVWVTNTKSQLTNETLTESYKALKLRKEEELAITNACIEANKREAESIAATVAANEVAALPQTVAGGAKFTRGYSVTPRGSKETLSAKYQGINPLTGDPETIRESMILNEKVNKSYVETSVLKKKMTFGTQELVKETHTETDALTGLKKKITEVHYAGGAWRDQLRDLRFTMVDIGFAVAAIGVAVSPFVLLTKYGMELETMFTKINIVTGESTKKISEYLQILKSGTQFSLVEMGEGFLEFTKQGFSAQDAMSAMPAITQLAVVGFTDLKTSTEIVAQTLHEFSMNATQASHVADVLAKAANMSAADVSTFGTAMAYVAPISEQAGISFEETSAALSILSNMGLDSTRAATSLSAAMNKMISPSAEADKLLRKMGITFFDAKGNMKDMDEIIGDLSVALRGLPGEERLKFLVDVFEQKGSKAVAGLMNAYESGQGSIAGFTKALDDSGYAAEQMMKIQTTAAGRMNTAWTDFQASFADTGIAFSDTLSGMLQSFNNVALEEKINELNIILGKTGSVLLTAPDLTVWEKFLQNIGQEISTFEMRYAQSKSDFKVIAEYFRYGIKASGAALETYFGGDNNEAYNEFLKLEAPWEIKIKPEIDKNEFQNAVQSVLIPAKTQNEIVIKPLLQKVLNTGTAGELKKYEDDIKKIKDAIDNINEASDKKLWEKGQEGLRKTIEMTNDLNTANVRLTEIYKEINPTINDAKIAVGEIQTELGKQKLTEKEINKYFVSNGKELNNILAKKLDINFLTTEEIKHYQYLADIVRNVTNDLKAQKLTVTALANSQEDLNNLLRSKPVDKRLEELDNMIEKVEDFKIKLSEAETSAYENSMIGKNVKDKKDYNKSIDDTITKLTEGRQSYIDLNTELVYQSELLKKATEIHDAEKDGLDKVKDKLEDYKNKLKGVNEELDNLKKPRFVGQLDIERLMDKIKLYIKTQKLADAGITDAQGYIQDALKNTKGGYDELISSINSVTAATDKGKNSYDAWKDTVEEFIKSTVKSGVLLGQNVSTAITKYSTLLLSTSKYGDETNKSEQYLSNLKDAYDVYYGGMTDDVEYTTKVHEEANAGIYSSSNEVITNLKEHWKEQKELDENIKNTNIDIEVLTSNVDFYAKGITFLTDEIKLLNIQLDDFLAKLLAISNVSSVNINNNSPSMYGYEDKNKQQSIMTKIVPYGMEISESYSDANEIIKLQNIESVSQTKKSLASMEKEQKSLDNSLLGANGLFDTYNMTIGWIKDGFNSITGSMKNVLTTGSTKNVSKTDKSSSKKKTGGTSYASSINQPLIDAGIMRYITKFATGGIVNSPTLAIVGEKGPEAIMPLRNNGVGLGNTTNITFGDINVSGGSGEPDEIARRIVETIRLEMRT